MLSRIATVAACAVDAAGREPAAREFANDPAGHAAFAAWIAECAPQGCRIGVEGALGFAFALDEHLLAEGLEVVEVPAHLTRRETKHRRGQGRSDPRDALAIARVTLREHKLAALRPAGARRALSCLGGRRVHLAGAPAPRGRSTRRAGGRRRGLVGRGGAADLAADLRAVPGSCLGSAGADVDGA
jgi:transposase